MTDTTDTPTAAETNGQAENAEPDVIRDTFSALLSVGHTESQARQAIEALRLMRDGGFRHVPVVDGDRLVGVVSRGDFLADERGRLEAESELWERL